MTEIHMWRHMLIQTLKQRLKMPMKRTHQHHQHHQRHRQHLMMQLLQRRMPKVTEKSKRPERTQREVMAKRKLRSMFKPITKC